MHNAALIFTAARRAARQSRRAEQPDDRAGLTGTDVEITLEISAERSSGFDDSTIRTINENSRTLKFKSHGFEGK